jgi:hypothetical protein
MGDEQKMDNNAETIVKVVGTLAEKTVVPIYEDLAKPSLKQIGEGLGGFLSIAMMPLQMMGYQAEHWKNEFQKSLSKKASKIPEENLQPPDPIVVGPIMHALGYTVHKEPLREMFTNLISTAMDSRIANLAHPSFTEIIKQINPDEAKILKTISARSGVSIIHDKDGKLLKFDLYRKELALPMAKLILKDPKESGYSVLKNNVCLLSKESNCNYLELESEYVENLSRLGLLQIDYSTRLNDSRAYLNLENWRLSYNHEFLDFQKDHELELLHGILRVTNFGGQFILACVTEMPNSHKSETSEGVSR